MMLKTTSPARMVIQIVSEFTNISVKDICSKSRKADTRYARQLTMYIMRFEIKMEFTEIAKYFYGDKGGHKDRSTIYSSVQKIQNDISVYPATQYLVNDIVSLLKRRLVDEFAEVALRAIDILPLMQFSNN